MTELQLYKFIDKNEIEVHWGGDKLIAFIQFCDLGAFTELCRSFFIDEAYEVHMKSDCVCIDLVEICNHFDIEPENILGKDEDR